MDDACAFTAKQITELSERGGPLQPLIRAAVSQVELNSIDCKRSFYIMGFLQEFFSFNFKRLHLLDLTGCYGFFSRSWSRLGGTASVVESKRDNQSLINKLCELENTDLKLYTNLNVVDPLKTKFDVLLLDEEVNSAKHIGKKPKKLAELLEASNFFVLNAAQEKTSIIKQLLDRAGFKAVKQTQEDSLGINLTIYSKQLRKYESLDGAFEIDHVFAVNDYVWAQVKTCIKQRASLYFKPNPTPHELQACIQASVCSHVPNVVVVQPSKLVLVDTGSFPLSHLPSRKGVNWEIIYHNATLGIEELHRHDIIHGNIGLESIWVNTYDQSVWLMCFEHAVINGEGWSPFHVAKWGKNKTSKIDLQGLNDAFSRLKA